MVIGRIFFVMLVFPDDVKNDPVGLAPHAACPIKKPCRAQRGRANL